MIKNFNYPFDVGETELYIGGYCPELGGDYTVAYLIPLDGIGWTVHVKGVKVVFEKAPPNSDMEYQKRLKTVNEVKMFRKTYRSAKIALGKINVSSCFYRETIRKD